MKQKTVSLFIALGLPVLMIIVIGLTVYLPSLFTEPPQTDFVFSSGGYYSSHYYQVSMGRIVGVQRELNENEPQYRPDPVLYYYDVSKELAREITLPDAQRLTLNTARTSPDGFELETGSGGDFFLGTRSNYNRQYLVKGAYSREVNLPSSVVGYYSFQFLGWVEKGDAR